MQACDLLTPEDLVAAGLLVVPGTATGLVSRTYFDGHGSTELPLPAGVGGVGTTSGEVNSCHYVVGVDPHTATVTVAVYQPAYVAQTDLDLRLTYDYRKSGDIGPVEVFQPNRPFGEYATPWLRHRDLWIQLTLGPFQEPVTAQLADTIARRVPAVAAHPGGPRRFTYRSPIFDVEYLNAYQLSAAEDFRALFGIEPSPSVQEASLPASGGSSSPPSTGSPPTTCHTAVHARPPPSSARPAP